ncbi:MAG: glycosyl hydrolase [Myxococcota bacterium]
MSRTFRIFLLGLFTVASCAATASQRRGEKPEEKGPLSAKNFAGMKLRNIGPALMSGRVADMAIHPDNGNVWYVGVGSGGVWKTENAGVTWTPIFDKQDVYSVGAVVIDPNNPHTVWVGTGENVGGRHVGFGDGIYRSLDDGKTWKNMGLPKSEHISEIIVHPEDSNTLWVAVQGPLWSPGGERGVFKTVDGGKKWTRLKVMEKPDEWTGVTSLVIDPSNPNTLYAATWQHHRTVAALMGGGELSGLYRTDDGGDNWKQLKTGLPKGAKGKIGLAVSPMKPDVVYAAIELNRRKGEVYRSTNRGESWTKMSETVSGGTGPHYYQELYASPHYFDRIYLADVWMQVSYDGGKTFKRLNSKFKHSDNHALEFRMDEKDFLLSGTDGGVYVSVDHAKSWRFMDNLPVTQYYKVAVDDAEPFYTVYGGTQDNNTQGGPSRTANVNGIRNADWFITLFADGHQPATEPGNPDIMYSTWQQGNLVRVDRTTGELVYIQPQPKPGEPIERFNWDAPVLVSPHAPATIFQGSQRVWKSENRGDSWTPISGDLTRDLRRVEEPIMGGPQSWDMPWDIYAMSQFSTLTSLAQSPKNPDVLWAGSDDGLIHVTSDGGKNWRKIPAQSIPGVSTDRAFINDIKADLFEANTAYVLMDNHKEGDFKPYLYKTTDLGRTWTSIRGDLPEKHLVWRIVQDHVQPNLFFLATEFGIFFTVDGGKDWTKLKGGAPTISFRDLAIQRRENDLVGASFGRGFFILDDYSPLREVSAAALEQPAILMKGVRDAWWYIEERTLGRPDKSSQGDAYYVAPNPPFGAVFTYYLKDELKTRAQVRQAGEKDGSVKKQFPGWDAVEAERRELKPEVLLTVSDKSGNVVRRLSGPVKAGIHRVAWDLRMPPMDPVGTPKNPYADEPRGFLAAPGEYTVSMHLRRDGKLEPVGSPVPFKVKPMRKGALPGATPEQVAAFWKRISTLGRSVGAAEVSIAEAEKRVKNLMTVLARSEAKPVGLDHELEAIRLELDTLKMELSGSPARGEIGAKSPETVGDRLSVAQVGTFYSTYGPTPMHTRMMEIAETDFAAIRSRLNAVITTKIPALEKKLIEAGGPWAIGQPVP